MAWQFGRKTIKSWAELTLWKENIFFGFFMVSSTNFFLMEFSLKPNTAQCRCLTQDVSVTKRTKVNTVSTKLKLQWKWFILQFIYIFTFAFHFNFNSMVYSPSEFHQNSVSKHEVPKAEKSHLMTLFTVKLSCLDKTQICNLFKDAWDFFQGYKGLFTLRISSRITQSAEHTNRYLASLRGFSRRKAFDEALDKAQQRARWLSPSFGRNPLSQHEKYFSAKQYHFQILMFRATHPTSEGESYALRFRKFTACFISIWTRGSTWSA